LLLLLLQKLRRFFSKSADPFEKYRANRESNPPRTAVVQLQRGTQLPATDPAKPVEVILASELDPTATLSVVDPTENREHVDAPSVRPGSSSVPLNQCDGMKFRAPAPDQVTPLVPAGVVSSMSIPVVPSNSSHSSISAIVERILKCGPMGRGEVDNEFFHLFRSWVFENLPDFGLLPEGVERMSFEEWNSVYGESQREQHDRARREARVDDNVSHRHIHDRGMFTKIESLPKSTLDGVVKLAPRGIQSGTHHHNVVTGPFCKSFSRMLKKSWDVDKAKGVMYTSGASAEQIGNAFQRMLEACPEHLIIEGDYARFDSTIHRMFLELEADIYRWCGCSPQEYAAFIACIQTKGVDKWRNRYTVDGGRHSGDHNTSCGNSLLQCLAMMFVLAFSKAMDGESLPSYRELVEKENIAMLALGDDNLLVGRLSFLSKFGKSGELLVTLLLRLGLELEPIVHSGAFARYHASFCSSRFYPVAGGKTVLAPGIGRGIAKSGWYVNPPVNMPVERLLRGDALSKIKDVWFVPFLGQMWRKNLDLSKSMAGQELLTRELKRSYYGNFHATQCHNACDETYQMIEILYGLTREQEKQYEVMLDCVTQLPCIVDYEPFWKAMVVDGVAADVFGETVPDLEVSHVDEMDELVFRTTVHRLVAQKRLVFFAPDRAEPHQIRSDDLPIRRSESVIGADEVNLHSFAALAWDQ